MIFKSSWIKDDWILAWVYFVFLWHVWWPHSAALYWRLCAPPPHKTIAGCPSNPHPCLSWLIYSYNQRESEIKVYKQPVHMNWMLSHVTKYCTISNCSRIISYQSVLSVTMVNPIVFFHVGYANLSKRYVALCEKHSGGQKTRAM